MVTGRGRCSTAPRGRSAYLERFFVRTGSAVPTHVFGTLTAFVNDRTIGTSCSLHRQLFLQAQKECIKLFA
jgi:hypothetical protein